jgi:hypothetical protein
MAGAVEIEDGGAGPGRIRLQQVADYSAESLHPFLKANLAPRRHRQDRRMVGDIPVLPASLTIRISSAAWPPMSCCLAPTASSPISNAGRSASITASAANTSRATSTEFVFRFNRRCTWHAAFRFLLSIAAAHPATPLQNLELTGSKGLPSNSHTSRSAHPSKIIQDWFDKCDRVHINKKILSSVD